MCPTANNFQAFVLHDTDPTILRLWGISDHCFLNALRYAAEYGHKFKDQIMQIILSYFPFVQLHTWTGNNLFRAGIANGTRNWFRFVSAAKPPAPWLKRSPGASSSPNGSCIFCLDQVINWRLRSLSIALEHGILQLSIFSVRSR